MKSKIGEKIFSETSEETKQKAIYYANNLVPKNIKLISMTDFVLTHDRLFILDSDLKFSDRKIIKEKRITNYAKFLKQPLKLEMFIPCDEDGNVLEYPTNISISNDFNFEKALLKYVEAKEKVLFEGFTHKDNDFLHNGKVYFSSSVDLKNFFIHYPTIEHLQRHFMGIDIILTPNVIKHLFG